MSHTDCLSAALSYADRGWRVVALHTPDADGACSCRYGADCEDSGKHPRYHRDLLPNGLLSATTDPEQIRRWWQRWPNANVGIATGPDSGLYVIDIDPSHDGMATLTELERTHTALPHTPRVTTGSGGSHDYLAYPGEADWPNTIGKLGAGIDTRGDGGMVVAPPSLHASGQRYRWEIAPDDAALADMPSWVCDLVHLNDVTPVATGLQHEPSSRVLDAFARQALADELAALARVREGGRNRALNRAAFNLGQLVANGVLDEQSTVISLESVAVGIGLGVRETRATILSGMTNGKKHKRDLSKVGQPKADTAPASAASRTDPPIDDADEVAPMRRYLTEYSNAQRLVAQHGADLCFVAERGWHVWNGKHWELDRTGEVMRRAKAMARTIEGEVEPWMSEKQQELLIRWARASESRSRLSAAIELAESEPGIPVRSEDLDTDPWLVVCDNGTIDLCTGQLLPHRREDYITKALATRYTPAATCPTWERFLSEVMDGNTEKIDYLQRAVGYTLTGSTREEVLFLMYGSGGNGKSKFLETLRELFGSYGAQTDPSTFLEKPGNDRIPTDIARLAGSRLVSAAETGDGKRLSEVLIKQITGGDTITARFLFRDEFEFKPACKLFFATNHKPVIKGTDEGIWRRMRLIPFTVEIPKAKRDLDLLTKLRAELPGILAWAVRGALAWQREGLNEPADVKLATDSYRAEMDIVGAFIGDCCVTLDGLRVSCEALYSSYHDWCESNGEWCFSQRRFANEIERRGFMRIRGAQGKWFRAGLGLLTRTGDDPDPEPEPSDDGSPSGDQVTQVIQGDARFAICSHEDSDSHATNTDSNVTLDHLDHLKTEEGEDRTEKGTESGGGGPPARVIPRQGAALVRARARMEADGASDQVDEEIFWPLPVLPPGWSWVPMSSKPFCRAACGEVQTKMYDRRLDTQHVLLTEIEQLRRRHRL